MIWFLLDAFKMTEQQKNRFRIRNMSKTKRKYLSIFISVAIFFFISITIIPTLFKIYWIGAIAFVIYVLTYIYSIRNIAKEKERDYEKNAKDYKNLLEDLSHILKKEVFQLYTEKQILKLIEDCNQILPTLQRSKSMFKPLTTLSTAILLPLITIALNTLFDNLSLDISLQVMIWMLLALSYLTIMYYIISPLVGEILDSDYNKLRKLRDMLSDISLMHFSKDEANMKIKIS